MSHPNPSTALARVVIDELAAGGVRFIAISPGSRSGALAIAAAEHPEIETRVVIDERSAAFHALGVAKAVSGPAAVISTSGTAAANFFPAVVEADMSGVPLVLVTADRPVEMHGVGANQTIDQVELYGRKVRAFHGIEAPEPVRDQNSRWRGAVADLLASSREALPGPVHLNVAFREPTVPVGDDGRSSAGAYPFATPRLDLPGTSPHAPAPHQLAITGERGLVVAGDGEYDRAGLLRGARELGWPVLATALSGLRGTEVVSAYHFLLDAGVPSELCPETVVAVGSIGPDPRLEALVAVAEHRIRVDRWGRHIDPHRNATAVVRCDPVELLGAVDGGADGSWAATWIDADSEVRFRVVDDVSNRDVNTGGGIAHAICRVGWHALVVASSLPIREVDAHLTRPGPVFANRGASGIDGFVSTALGVAGAIPGTLAFSGDLSLLHDSNGFLHDGSIDLTVVVADNGGGGLFDSLPQARHAPGYERLFVSPPGRDLGAVVESNAGRAHRVSSPSDLGPALEEGLGRPGLDVVIAPVDREIDLAARSRAYL